MALKITAGIYQIMNKFSGDFYIGSSVNISNRLGNHIRRLRSNKHDNQHLQNAWNKYGANNFEFKVILYCDKEMCIYYEQACIDGLKPEYNILPTAGSPLGHKHTSETRTKMSAARIGIKLSDETRAKMSACQLGKKYSDEHKAKLRAAHLGHKHSEETKAKIGLASRNVSAKTRQMRREAMLGNTICVGRKVSEEHKRKVSLSLIGNTRRFGCKCSEETKAKMSAVHLRMSDETKAKMSAAKLNMSAETKMKLSTATKLYWERKHSEVLSG